MSLRWPDVDLLRRGDLLALSPLSPARLRQKMADALRQRAPEIAHHAEGGPEFAMITALAACIEVMGFYHDRILTESKLGSAQLLDNLGKIVALIGYRPLPSVAATAYQFFEAIAVGTVGAAARVAGKVVDSPSTVMFETDAVIEVSPELNHMALSPLVTRSPGARRVVLTQLIPGRPAATLSPAAEIAAWQKARGPALPTDDFRPRTQTIAMVADARGLELAVVDDSRRGGVALARGLSRSFEVPSALVSRATVIRRLGAPRALSDDLVAYEVSEGPILYLPDNDAPGLRSLELFVLRAGDDKRDPSEWDPTLRYTEVLDFSGSEVSDLHYRTFVDDALHTWIILRRKLGAHTLLPDDPKDNALHRVYARFVPALGAVVRPLTDHEIGSGKGAVPSPKLVDVTVGLDAGAFETSLVFPLVANTRLSARATWAMVDRDLGLSPGDSILIQDTDGTWVRTLVERPTGMSPRLLRWAPATGEPGLPRAHDPIEAALDPASAKIIALRDAATGDAFPTWSDFYAQLAPPRRFRDADDDFPIVLASAPDPAQSPAASVIQSQCVIASGATYLVVDNAVHIAAGDYLVLGRRLTEPFRVPQLSGSWRWKAGEPPFDPRAPWLDAEVVQALEIRGNVVRLAAPVSQAYVVHEAPLGEKGAQLALSEVILVPGVASVASGDQLRQTLSLSTQPSFRGKDGERYDASYVTAVLDRGYRVGDLRRPLVTDAPAVQPGSVVALPGAGERAPRRPPPPSPRQLWDALFVAVAGVAEVQREPQWHCGVVVQSTMLRAPAQQFRCLEDAMGARLTEDGIYDRLEFGRAVPLVSVEAAAQVAHASDGTVVAVLDTPPVWRGVARAPDAHEFQILEVVSFDLVPTPPELASETLFGDGGTLILTGNQPPYQATFTWDSIARAVRVRGAAPAISDPFEALVISKERVDLPALLASRRRPGRRDAVTADWSVSSARFAPGAFGEFTGGELVAVTAAGEVAFEAFFARSGDSVDVELQAVPVSSLTDPLHGVDTVWPVSPTDLQITRSAVQARWIYQLAASEPNALRPSADVHLALLGVRREIVAARTTEDGRTAIVDPDLGVRAGDLGFALDLLCVLDGPGLTGSQVSEATIWSWLGIDPALVDLPGPRDAQFVAVLPAPGGVATVLWQRDEVWWDPARRTLRLPVGALRARPETRPSDLVRLLEVAAPSVAQPHFTVDHDVTTDRSIVTMAMAPGWPRHELAPAPVLVATTPDGSTEVRDLLAPVEIVRDAHGRVRWTMHVAGDVRAQWTALGVVLRDWSAPAERGLIATPLWRVAVSAWPAHTDSPVILIVTMRAHAGFLAITVMPRPSGDLIELVAIDGGELPAAALVQRVYVASYTVVGSRAAPLALRGTTTVDISGPVEPAPVGAVVFRDGTQWQPITVTTTTTSPDGGQRYELADAYLSLFPDGIASEPWVRLCYLTGQHRRDGATTAAIAVIAGEPSATAHRLRLELAAGARSPDATSPGVEASAAVLNDGSLADRIVLDTDATPTVSKDGALVLPLALGARGLAAVFDDQGAPRRRWLTLAQRWPFDQRKKLARQPLRIKLGSHDPSVEYGVFDLDLGFGRPPVRAFAHGYDPAQGLLDLAVARELDPEELEVLEAFTERAVRARDTSEVASLARSSTRLTLTLHGLKTPVDASDYVAILDLAPSSAQPPWLLSFWNRPDPSSLVETLLLYSKVSDGELRGTLRFTFSSAPHTLIEIFKNAAGPLYLLNNERAELRSDFYTASTDEVFSDLAEALPLAPAAPPNFLDLGVSDATVIDQLVLASSAWAGKDLTAPRPVILCAKASPHKDEPLRISPEGFREVKITAVKPRRVATSVVLQSTRFNTGNFISLAGQGTTPADAASLMAAALQISAMPVDRAGNPRGDWRPVERVSLEELGQLRSKLAGAGQVARSVSMPFEGLTLRRAVEAGEVPDQPQYKFSASFSPAGACTLHFLFADEALIETVRVRIEAQYEVNPGRPAERLSDPIYPLETKVAAFDPATRLALLAPGQLKPGTLLFVRWPRDAGVTALQWTIVTQVRGSIVAVDPPLAYPDPDVRKHSLEPVEVLALGKLGGAAQLDADYYATVLKAKLAPLAAPEVPQGASADTAHPPSWWTMPLRDRLPLDAVARPSDGGPSLLAALVPGDAVLVFDERSRQAWARRRQGVGASAGEAAWQWQQWPDFQHLAVVKRIDADTGLVVLDAPLPDRFRIRWRLEPASEPAAGVRPSLIAYEDDITKLRVLPHYRAPVQGRRTMTVLGSGDSGQRFARYVSSVDTATGSATIPLAEGVTTGNLEVLSFDPEKRSWTRWLRYDQLSRAGKKTQAYQLGFRTSDTGDAPVSVTFGDGLTGQIPPTGTDNLYLRATRIGAASSWLVRRRPVRIIERTPNVKPPPAIAKLAIATAPITPRAMLSTHLRLRLACSALAELSGGVDLGAAQWRQALELTVTTSDKPLEFREITAEEAAKGKHGFLVVSDLDMPPGVVELYLSTTTPIDPDAVEAWQVPGPRQWALDEGFYERLSSPDLADKPGAKSLQLLSTTGLRAGSFLALVPQDGEPPDIVRLASIDPPTWSARVEAPLPRAYDLAGSFLRGNLVRIVQGAVERTTIGSSDGATPLLRLPLPRAPLLYLAEPGKPPAPDVTVFVSNQPWERVLDFEDQKPSSRVWRLDIEPDGAAFVLFGNGKRGAIPSAGRDHIEAQVRVGSGAAGNLAAGAISQLVSGNIAVKSTTNLTPASGGSAGDEPAAAREKAFAHRLPSDRVVSAGDCVRVALGVSDVISAALDPGASAGTVTLVVALAGRRELNDEDKKAVRERVTGAMPVTTRVALQVVAAAQIAVHLVVQLGVRRGFVATDVYLQVRAAFAAGPAGFFAAERWEIGEPLRLGAIYDALFRIAGVAHARVIWMAGTALSEGESAPGPAPDVFDPGATGVVRCDSDPVGDPFGRFGTFRIEAAREGAT